MTRQISKLGCKPGNRHTFPASLLLLLCAAFVLSVASGTNHSCPVLRERDLRNMPGAAQALPAFARKYNVDCTYCHVVWPRLNLTGYEFKRLGYRLPYEVGTSPSKKPHKHQPKTQQQPGKPLTTENLSGDSSVSEGENLFKQSQCSTCHVDGGNIVNPAKPIKGEAFQKKYADDKLIADLVRKGVAGTAMPAYDKTRLSDEQLKAIISYIRSLTPQSK